MNDLNKEQLAAVNSNSGDIVVMAGPGSGKSRVLISRIMRMVADGFQPDQMVAITFTNAAAAELKKRLPENLKLGYCGTLHGFVLQLLKRYHQLIGLPAHLTVIDTDQRDELVNRCAAELNYKGTKKDLAAALKLPVLSTISDQQWAFTDSELVAVKYNSLAYSSGALDFDSILRFGAALAVEMQSSRESFWFAHLFVDEFQDATDDDMEIYLKLRFMHRFFVGDADQGIYSFRGGNSMNIFRLAQDVDWESHYLEANYRSGRSICQAAQRLIEHNTVRLPKSTVSACEFDGTVEIVPCADPLAEMAMVATQLSQIDPTKAAVLCRTRAITKQFTDYFTALGVKVKTRQQQDKPVDWSMTRRFIASASPNNDLLADDFLRGPGLRRSRITSSARHPRCTRRSMTFTSN